MMLRKILVVLAVLAPTSALAQANFVPRDLTRGVRMPFGAAGDFDATAVITNPAGLGTLARPNLAFAYTRLDDDTHVGGGGWALSLAMPLRLPVGPERHLTLTYGFGFQGLDSPTSWLSPVPGLGGEDGSYILNSFALGAGPVSLGWTVGTFFWSDTPQDESITTHSIGLSLRPSRYAAAGVVFRDVFEPVGRGIEEKFHSSYEGELAVRPLGDWRVEVAGGVSIGADRLLDPRARARIRPARGIAVFAQYESVERRFGAIDAELSRDHRIAIGLELDGLDSLVGAKRPALGATTASTLSSRGSGRYAGTTVMGRWSLERYPPIVERDRAVEVAFDDRAVGSDRAFVDWLLSLDRIARDRSITAVAIVVARTDIGWGRAEEIREVIGRLVRSGKKVIAYLETGDARSYYAVAASTRVLLDPTTSLRPTGVAIGALYVRDLLDKVGVAAQVVRIGDYKTAPEAFTRSDPSDEAREQLDAYVQDVSKRVAAAIAEDRRIGASDVAQLAERVAISPTDAMALRLVDGIATRDELEKVVREVAGRRIDLAKLGADAKKPEQWAFPKIAVIHIDGEIVPGRAPTLFSPAPTGDQIADAIAAAREDRQTEAIVLRVNSPGGTVKESERIAREVELTRKAKKPIVISMGDFAASGGYMASAWGDQVFALPSTLTGSIGIFAVKLEMSRLLGQLGIAQTTLKAGEHADAGSTFRPWTEIEMTAKHDELAHLYGRFVAIVAGGRGLEPAAVETIARGRIWSGAMAQDRKLVDRGGSVMAAIDEARRRAGLPSTAAIAISHEPTVDGGIVATIVGGPSARAIDALRASLPAVVHRVLAAFPPSLSSGEAVMTRLPWSLSTP